MLNLFGRPDSERSLKAARQIAELLRAETRVDPHLLLERFWTQDTQIRLETLVLDLDIHHVRILGFDAPVMSDPRYIAGISAARYRGAEVSAFVHVEHAGAAARSLPGAAFRFSDSPELLVRGRRIYTGNLMFEARWSSSFDSLMESGVWHRSSEIYSVIDRGLNNTEYAEKTFDRNPERLLG